MLALIHTGMTTDEFDDSVRSWLATALHPPFRSPLRSARLPSSASVAELSARQRIRTYIVSGEGSDFMRAFLQRIYDIAPEQVVGPTGMLEYQLREGKPVLIKTADYVSVDDSTGEPAGIHQYIARRPILAVATSDGDCARLGAQSGDAERIPLPRRPAR